MNRRTRRGFTLIEVVMSMVIAAILVAATMSSVVIGLRGFPTSSDAPTNTILAGRAMDQMAGELETALLVVSQKSTSITFTVPPRGSDTTPERISYSWDGNAGDPLMRTYNQGAAVDVLDKVYAFSLTPTIATYTESYPGIGVEDATSSLLIDESSSSNLNNQNVSNNNWAGQLFSPAAWPSGVVGWRPTQVTFEAERQGGQSSSTAVQFWYPNSTQLPTIAIPEQYTLSSSNLSYFSYAWQSFNFTTIPRLAPAAAICLVLEGLSANGQVSIESNNNSGLLQGNVGQSSVTWQYQSNNALQARIYGKLTRSSTTQYATSKYISALTVQLQAGSSNNLQVQTTAQCLNHPELLSVFTECKFASDPTKLDSNGDGLPDWTQPGGGTFNTSTLINGTWQPASGADLISNPGDNYSHLTMIDVRFCGLTTGSTAQFSINAARNGSTCAPITAQITLMADGTQTLTMLRNLSDLTTDTMLLLPQLPAGPTDLHMVIDPTNGTVSVEVNGTQYGSFAYNLYASSNASTGASLSTSGTAEFSYFRLREVQP